MSTKNSKSAKPTTESVSKYFLRTEVKDVRYNFTAKPSEKPMLKNSNTVDPPTALDDSTDDFRSPLLLRRRNNCTWKLNKTPKQLTVKAKNTGSKKRVTKNSTIEIVKKNVDSDDTNPEHLQMAIALSKSSFEAEYGHSVESQEKVDTPDISVILQNAKPTSLEKFGFKSCRSVLPVSNQKIHSGLLEASKKIKNRYKYITPILSIRTKEDREALINSKIFQLLGQSDLRSKTKLDRLPISSTLFNYLPKRRIFPLDDIYDSNCFKIDCLGLPNNPAKCGCLLKDWGSIPGRDKSPVKQKIMCPKSKYLSSDSKCYMANSPDTLDNDTVGFKNQDSIHTSCRGLSPDIFGSEEEETPSKKLLDFSKEAINKYPKKIENINKNKVEIIDLTVDDAQPLIGTEKINSSVARVANFYSLDEFEVDTEMKFGKNDLVNDVSDNSKMEIYLPASCNRSISDIDDKIGKIPSIVEELHSALGCNEEDEDKNKYASVGDSFKIEVSCSGSSKYANNENRSFSCNLNKSDFHYEISPDVESDNHESFQYSYLECLSPEPVKAIANSPFTNHNSLQNGKHLSSTLLDCKYPAPQNCKDTEIMAEKAVKPSPKISFQGLEERDFEIQFNGVREEKINSYKKHTQSPPKGTFQDTTYIELSDDSSSENQIDLDLNKSLKSDPNCAASSDTELITKINTSEGTQTRVTSPLGTDFELHFDDKNNISLRDENQVLKDTVYSSAKQNMVSIEISEELFLDEQQDAQRPNKTLSPYQIQVPVSPLTISLKSDDKSPICRPSRGYNSADLNVTDYVNALLNKDNYSFENCGIIADNHHSKEDEDLSQSQDNCIEDEELNYSCYFTATSTARRYSEEKEYDLDDDEICAVSEGTEIPVFGNGPISPSNSPQEIKVIKTPENYIIKTRNITPIPDFDSMTTPLIHKELQKFGVKRLKRARGAKLLKYIYESTHPLVESVDFVEECGSDDEGKIIKRRKKAHDKVQKTESVCDVKNNQEASAISKMEIIYSEVDIIGDRLLADEKCEDLVFERRQSTKIPSCPVPLQIIWYNFLCCNADIKEKILLYEPLHLETLHGMLKELGFKFHIQDLLTFLDKKCITIRTSRKRAKR